MQNFDQNSSGGATRAPAAGGDTRSRPMLSDPIYFQRSVATGQTEGDTQGQIA